MYENVATMMELLSCLSACLSVRLSPCPVRDEEHSFHFNLLCLFLLNSNYVIMVTMFFTVSVINNYALNFNIAMPLHMIFRSVSLLFINVLMALNSQHLMLLVPLITNIQ